MNKYINIEVAKEYLRRDSFSNPYFRSQACQQAMDVLDTVPAADVVEVKHGQWHDKTWTTEDDWSCYNHHVVICSVCNKQFDYIINEKSNYCPNCGAKMKGGKNE